MIRTFKPSTLADERAFLRTHCDRCTRSLCRRPCPILLTASVTDDTDPDYPIEWIVDDDGAPHCTAFRDRAEARAARLARCLADMRVTP